MLYLAYDYAGHIGQPVSAVLDLPLWELYGYAGYRRVQAGLLNDG